MKRVSRVSFEELNDVELVVVVCNIRLIQHAVFCMIKNRTINGTKKKSYRRHLCLGCKREHDLQSGILDQQLQLLF